MRFMHFATDFIRELSEQPIRRKIGRGDWWIIRHPAPTEGPAFHRGAGHQQTWPPENMEAVWPPSTQDLLEGVLNHRSQVVISRNPGGWRVEVEGSHGEPLSAVADSPETALLRVWRAMRRYEVFHASAGGDE